MKKIPTEIITGDRKAVYSIYELMGMKVNPYRHGNLEEYRAYLEGLTFSDMQDHAVNEAGTIPFDNRDKLMQHLERQFLTITGQIEANVAQNKESLEQMDNSKKKSHLTEAKQKQLKDLLSKGR